MKNRKMFGILESYKSKEFYEKNKIINFYTLKEDKTIKKEYEIFAVFKTIVYSSNDFKYYNYTDFNSKKEFDFFINTIQNTLLYKTNIIPQYGNKFVTLSTCEYSNRNGRLVIMAKEV